MSRVANRYVTTGLIILLTPHNGQIDAMSSQSLRVRPRKYRLSDVEGVIYTHKLREHTDIEVIVDVLLRVVVVLSSIGR